MKTLTADEKVIIKEDIKELVGFCLKNDLIDDNFKERYEGLDVVLDNITGACNAGGKVDHQNKRISLQTEDMYNDLTRRMIFYHEMGHLLFDYKAMKNENINAVEKRVLNLAQTSAKNTNPLKCLAGLSLIQEYIAEKFSSLVTAYAFNSDVKLRKDISNRFCKNYIYDTTFYSAYGIIETILDNLFKNENIISILKESLNSEFYINLFTKYNEKEIMLILEKLGDVYNALDLYTAKDITADEKNMPLILNELSSLTNSINLNNVKSL